MDIQEIKTQMLAFKDFFGADLLDISEVHQAKSKGELRQILDRHSDHIEMQCNDAMRHLGRFKAQLFNPLSQ